MENRRVDRKERGPARSREVRLPPLPPGLEVYRPADVLGSSVLVVEDEAAMQQQLRIDLHDLGYRVFIEIGPRPALLVMARRCQSGDTGLWLPSLRENGRDWQSMLDALGTLYVHGAAADWD